MKKFLVIGAGISGITLANLIAQDKNNQIVIIEKRNHIGGNCYDYKDENKITIQAYGSHIFHTSKKEIWEYVNKYSKFNNYQHKVLASINNNKINLPFNLNSLYQAFEEKTARNLENKLKEKFSLNSKISILDFQKEKDKDLNFLANYIYENIFKNYSAKQWGVRIEEIDKNIFSRVPIYINYNNNYFQNQYQGIPQNGFSRMFLNMLNKENIEITLNTNFKEFNSSGFDKIFYTGSIDEYFNYSLGQLEYRSLNFEFEKINLKNENNYYQVNSVINYPNDFNYTRIHEFKHYLNEKSLTTIIAKEYPKKFILGENERYYPILNSKNKELYEKYLTLSQKNTVFFGRLGDYKYYDMDCAIERSFKIYKKYFK